METGQPTSGTQFKKSTTIVLDDEKTKIIEDTSPEKTRETATSLPVIESEPETKEKTYSSRISEYRAFGKGNVDLLCCRFDPDDTMIASGSSDGTVQIYSLTEPADKPIHMMNGAEMPGIPITSLRWRPHTGANKVKHILLSACADGSISHWHVPSGKLLHRIVETDNQVLCMDYNKDGSNFATAGKDRKIRIYDENTKSMVVELAAGFMQNPGHSNRIFSLKYHPEDLNVLISGAWDNTVYFWDTRDGKSYASIYGPAISGDALDIKGNTVLTGSWRSKDQLELWDFSSRKKITTVEWEAGQHVENAYIYSCQFSKANNDSIIAGCSKLNEVRVFNRKDGNKNFGKITHLSKGVYSVDYAHTMDLFAFCGGEGRVHAVQIHK